MKFMPLAIYLNTGASRLLKKVTLLKCVYVMCELFRDAAGPRKGLFQKGIYTDICMDIYILYICIKKYI